MSVTETFYSADLVKEHCEVHFACGGFWDVGTMRQFLDELNATTAPLVKAGKPIYAMGDFTKALPQDRETADLVANHLRKAAGFGLKRIAVINATPLMKMQYRRVSQGLEVEFFESKVTGLGWLREDR